MQGKKVGALVKIVREISLVEIFSFRTYSLRIRSPWGRQNWNYSSLFEGVQCVIQKDLFTIELFSLKSQKTAENTKAHLQYLRDKYILERAWKVLLSAHFKISTLLYRPNVVDKETYLDECVGFCRRKRFQEISYAEKRK